MAVIKPGSLVAEIRGKVGEHCFSRNRGGPYVRAIGIVDQLGEGRQLVVWNALKILARGWGGELTEAQRERWDGIAASTYLPDRWGVFKPMRGKDLFIKCNFNWYQAEPSIRFRDCPDDPVRACATFELRWACPEELIEVELPLGNYPTPAEGTFAFLYMGKAVSQTTNYYKGPWRLTGDNLFTEGQWEEDPWWPNYEWNFYFGDRIFMELLVCHSTLGWTSSRTKAFVDIVACNPGQKLNPGELRRQYPVPPSWARAK